MRQLETWLSPCQGDLLGTVMCPLAVRLGDPMVSESQGPLLSGSSRGKAGSWEAGVSQHPGKACGAASEPVRKRTIYDYCS